MIIPRAQARIFMAGDVRQDGNYVCASCGRELAYKPAKKALSSAFNQTELFLFPGKHLCSGCLQLFGDKDGRSKCLFYPFPGEKTIIEREQVLEILKAPPKTPFVLSVPYSFKKHHWLFAGLSAFPDIRVGTDGVDTGNAMLFRRMTVISPSGAPVQVPAISGNALRGVMRRILTRELFYRLGLRGKADDLYIAMANGGALGKTLDSYIYPDKVAAVRELVPMLSTFGGALYTYMLPGRAGVSFAVLECQEAGTGPLRVSDLTEDIGLTRHLDRTEVLTPEEIKPMPYTIETVIKGAIFDFSVWTDDYATDLEKACLFHALKRLDHVGGKSSGGFGEIHIAGIPDDSAYLDWLETRDQAYAEKLIEYSKGMAKC